MINATPTQLRKAADIQERIQSLQEELGQLLGGSGPGETAAIETRKKRKFSAYTRAKMRAAQKARWAAKKGVKVGRPVSVKSEATPKKKQVSDARLKALAKAREARWAKIKETKASKAVQKPKIQRSAAWRAGVSAAAKARWAKAKKAGKSRW
jgi:preprotein translocase subunit SecD